MTTKEYVPDFKLNQFTVKESSQADMNWGRKTFQKNVRFYLCVMAHTSNASTKEAEEGGTAAQTTE